MTKAVWQGMIEEEGLTDFETLSTKSEIKAWQKWATQAVKDGEIISAAVFTTHINHEGSVVADTHYDPIWSVGLGR